MKKLFSFIASALLVLTGCTEEDVVKQSLPMGKIQASFEDGVGSRLAVGEGNALTWSAGDAFTVFKADGASANWTLEGEGGTTSGVFVGTEPEGTQKIVGAAFPASVLPVYNRNELTMSLPATLTYQAGVCNLPMWASFSTLEGDIVFKHLAALLKINFSNIPEGYNQLIVTANRALAGTFTTNVSQAEAVLSLKENGSKSVTINFDGISGEDNHRLFYLPLPVGTYGSINVSISDGENTQSIADWKDRTIERKKVYLASLTYRVLEANGNEGLTPELVSETLSEMATVTPNATVEIAGEIKAEDGAITIPAETSKVGLNFVETPVTSSVAPLVIEEAVDTEGTQLTISLPSDEESYVEFDTPTTTVNVAGGNYKTIVAHTAANTLVLGEGTTVDDLVIKGGNVSLQGGVVTGSITRAEGVEEVIYVNVQNEADLEGVTLGEGVEKVVPDYVTFTADAEQTLTLSKIVETLEYSVNGGEWTDLGTSTVTFGGSNGDLRLRGKSAYGTAVSSRSNENAIVKFGNESVLVACTGDIRTLVDYEKYNSDDLDTSGARFLGLFSGCKVLTSAPKLPATVLADYCYSNMFSGCTALTETPELPATTLAANCYYGMFQNCTALTEAPELPATTLATACYYYMFQNCTGLTATPKLPVTTLVARCYGGMFYGCTGLTEAPELPATTLAESCYSGMFACTGLTAAPELPVTTLAAGCYGSMFYGCTALTEAPVLPATTLAESCYSNMFSGCTSLTETPELPATTLAAYCYNNMFQGCSNLSVAPELPATTLAEQCYYGMFESTGLTAAPELPATTMVYGCYFNMFKYCKNLIAAPELPATVLADYCYRNMFSGCTSLTEAPELPVTKLAMGCYSIMFADCTSLTKAPVLPATTLVNGCYQLMFTGCSNLSEVTMLATDIDPKTYALTNWIQGVSATGTLYKNSELTNVSTLGIPEGWELKDYIASSEK